MVLTRADDLRLTRGPWRKAFAVLLVVCYLSLPHWYSDASLSVLTLVAAFAIGSIGLNLLVGYTGQVSLGHAAFVSIGAFATSALGDQRGWPLPAYLAVAVLVGLLVGAIVGPFALRLRGNYLAIVTIGLVFVAEHIYRNWESLSVPVRGTAPTRNAAIELGPLDFGKGLQFGDVVYTREQSLFWLAWALVALTALVAHNITRTRSGSHAGGPRPRPLRRSHRREPGTHEGRRLRCLGGDGGGRRCRLLLHARRG